MEDDDAPSIIEDMSGSAVFIVEFATPTANGAVEVRAFSAADAQTRFLASYLEAERGGVTISSCDLAF